MLKRLHRRKDGETLGTFEILRLRAPQLSVRYRHSATNNQRIHQKLNDVVMESLTCAIGRFYPSVGASEAIREIAWESDRQFAGTRD